MKKIILSSIITAITVLPAFAMTEIQKGLWVSDIKQKGHSISYSMKISSDSELWSSYAAENGMSDVSFGYALLNYNIDCKSGKFNISASILDENGQVKEKLNLNERKNSEITELNQNISMLCSSYESNKQ